MFKLPRSKQKVHLSWMLILFLSLVLNQRVFAHSLTEQNLDYSATEIIQNMLNAQSGLKDFHAKVKLTARIGFIPLLPLSGDIYSKRPSQVKAVIGEILFLPQYRFIFPDPLQFASSRYTLKLVGTTELEGQKVYIIDVSSKEESEENLNMRFWISSKSWLIIKSDMSVPGMGRTVMQAKYIQAAPNAWIPTELKGEGGLLLANLLPPSGFGKLLSKVALTDDLHFQMELSKHQVNIGLTDSYFLK
ncbi:MAG: hypothetical protein H0Z38_04420 [Firmicutes bacterium]|nr:hypothetical protein [Bacillota bacterium]